MAKDYKRNPEIEEQETTEWLYSLDYVFEHGGPERVRELLTAITNSCAQSWCSYSLFRQTLHTLIQSQEKSSRLSLAIVKLKEE